MQPKAPYAERAQSAQIRQCLSRFSISHLVSTYQVIRRLRGRSPAAPATIDPTKAADRITHRDCRSSATLNRGKFKATGS